LTSTSSNYSEGKFEGERGTEIYYRTWKPAGSIRASVVVTHGQGDHGGRYPHVAEHLTREGFAMYAADLRGHGRSGGRRGHVDDFDDYLADARRVIEEAKAVNPQVKTFLLGHSLGGLIVLDYAEKMGSTISGVIATGPLLRLKMKVPAWKIALGRVFSSLTPTLSMKTGLDPNLLSHDQQIVRDYINDPLVHGVASTRFYTELMRAVDETVRNGGKLTLPCLVMVGTGDGIVDSSVTQEFFKTIASSDKTLKVYDGFYHEVLNEPQKDTLLDEITTWISGRI
jgi:alpha-beta hydrolase superfamily lysophospholipase